MKRPPSVFSYIKVLEVGDSTSLPSDKTYAARCACSFLEAEYGRTFTIAVSPGGDSIIIMRNT